MKLYIKNIFLQTRDLNVKAKQTKKREINYYNTFNELHGKISHIMVNKKQNNHNKADIKQSMYMKLKNKHNEAASQGTLSNPHFLQTVRAGLDH